MCDPHVVDLLKQWGVQSLLNRCREQEVDLEALRTFNEDVISELVPLIGPRSKFLKGWRAWRETGAATTATTASSTSALTAPLAAHSGLAAAAGAADLNSADRHRHRMGQLGQPQRPLWEQPGPSDFEEKREVSVVLEGKITYDDDNSAIGWLVADGFLNPRRGRGAAASAAGSTASDWPSLQTTVKTEPIDDDAPPLPQGPRFQLQGRISLSLQDLAELPAFMLGSPMELEDVCVETAMLQPDSDPLSAAQLGQASTSSPDAAQLAATATPLLTPPRPSPANPPSPAKRAKRGRSHKLDLEVLLNASSKGKMILSLYQQKGNLDGPARQALTDIIIAEELREDFNRRISSQRFQDIAATIVDLFPGENEDTYYYNERAYGERPGGKGKLTSKYYNTRRQLAKSGVIARMGHREKRKMLNQRPLTLLQLSSEEQETALNSIKWLNKLQNVGWQKELSSKNLEMALCKWCDCWKIRMSRILSPGHHPAVYVDEYPVLRMALGEKLIKADFDKLFKNAGNRLIDNWSNFSKSVIVMLLEDYRKQMPLLDYVKRHVTTVKGREAAALLLLPSSLPISTCKGQGETAELWRPTRQEAQDGFLLHVERDSDVNAALQKHWSRVRLMGQPMCPLPVVVGPSLDQLQSALVALDENTAFTVPDVVSAVDLCFKSFHALQVPYPPHAQNVWLFLQHAVYQVATPLDRVSVAVSSLLADFGLKPAPPVESWDQVLLQRTQSS